ncbi:uncharacterized protein LOC131942770 [Physella acuta]|uniref:uncharacterized protein LOC131942770 n=1 Tax=Physella acuta TaxID=109671 RepID=UPI0027DD7A2A|nr:uncharacterized protein LOC131942770 [Physella acuta]
MEDFQVELYDSRLVFYLIGLEILAWLLFTFCVQLRNERNGVAHQSTTWNYLYGNSIFTFLLWKVFTIYNSACDPFCLLGLSKSATVDEIKHAFKSFYRSRNPEKYQQIENAYYELMNEDSRLKWLYYDKLAVQFLGYTVPNCIIEIFICFPFHFSKVALLMQISPGFQMGVSVIAGILRCLLQFFIFSYLTLDTSIILNLLVFWLCLTILAKNGNVFAFLLYFVLTPLKAQIIFVWLIFESITTQILGGFMVFGAFQFPRFFGALIESTLITWVVFNVSLLEYSKLFESVSATLLCPTALSWGLIELIKKVFDVYGIQDN